MQCSNAFVPLHRRFKASERCSQERCCKLERRAFSAPPKSESRRKRLSHSSVISFANREAKQRQCLLVPDNHNSHYHRSWVSSTARGKRNLCGQCTPPAITTTTTTTTTTALPHKFSRCLGSLRIIRDVAEGSAPKVEEAAS